MSAIPEFILRVIDEGVLVGNSGRLVKPSFTKNYEVRNDLSECVLEIVCKISQVGGYLDEEAINALVFKLAAHASKSDFLNESGMQRLRLLVPGLTAAILENPECLKAPVNIKSILRSHAERSRQAKKNLAKQEIASSEPTLVLSTNNPSYDLYELITPEQLQEESVAIHHCVGTIYNMAALNIKGLTTSDLDARKYLHYAIKIRNKTARIFSLRGQDGTRVTIEYDCHRKVIRQMEGRSKSITGNELFFAALCEALYGLGEKIPIKSIGGLPRAPGDHALGREGVFFPYGTRRDDSYLSGTVCIRDDTHNETIQKYGANPRLTLDVTELSDLGRLPSHIQAAITSTAEIFIAPGLIACRDLILPRGKIVKAPKLEVCENIDAIHVKSLLAPRLRIGGDMDFYELAELNLPELEKSGSINAIAAKRFDIPNLRVARDLYANSTLIFNAQKLRNVQIIRAGQVECFDVPELNTAENIDAPRARYFHIPKLRNSWHINASSTESFFAPQLEVSGYINAIKALEFIAPSLQMSGNIFAHHAIKFLAPKLHSSGDIEVNERTEFLSSLIEKKVLRKKPSFDIG